MRIFNAIQVNIHRWMRIFKCCIHHQDNICVTFFSQIDSMVVETDCFDHLGET